MTEEDILFRVKLDTLQTKLTKKITEDKTKVTDEDIEDYYEKNKKRFAQPERRDLNVVLTKTKAKADAGQEGARGRRELQGRREEVLDRPGLEGAGRQAARRAKGQQEKALDEAVFKAEKGEVEGPVKTQFGYYVFEVTKIKTASQQSLEQAKETIRNLLRSQREQKALDAFIKDFREDYKDETKCARGLRVAECKNAPEGEDRHRPASGGAPGGAAAGAPQGAPRPAGRGPAGRAPQGAAPQGAPRRRPSAAPQRPSTRAADAADGSVERARSASTRSRGACARDCPWDREQDERSIVPHTVEEAYELADAAHSGDDAKLLDELGDVLFQVMFLSLLLEERGAGDLAAGRRRTAARS